jgi:DNA (cytosine-5)-methyltransferase 1
VAAYYNEIDSFAAAWLRELIKAGLIADGEVDERSIELVRPDDLRGFTQCHFFAGIGGWSLACRLAQWSDDTPVWSGSCPCQPFSSAGAQVGGNDPRHLWPAWFGLITECRPPVVFGEQVESAIGHGWIDLVCDDLEREGYAVGAASLPAPSVGAFHIRQRVWFVADAAGERRTRERILLRPEESGRNEGEVLEIARSGAVGELADADASRRASWRSGKASDGRVSTRVESPGLRDAGFWASAEWIPCADGKARPVEPGTFPLAHGVSARVGRLRGYGNAIVPALATAFVKAYCEAERNQ